MEPIRQVTIPIFVKVGLLLLCLFGIAVGSTVFFDESLLLKLCGKSCGITEALVTIFGKDFAKALISAIWFAGAALMGWLVIRKR